MKTRLILSLFSLLMILLMPCASLGTNAWDQQACAARKYENSDSVVCVCNATHCDSFADYNRTDRGTITVWISDRSGKRFAQKRLRFGGNNETNRSRSKIGTTSDPLDPVVLTIDRASEKRQQRLLGFGGAFTDATGINIRALDRAIGDRLIADYFANDGLRYSMARVPIGGSDFSTRPYTYDDMMIDHEAERNNAPDFDLAHFALAPEDIKYKIPLIKQAQKLATTKLKLFASPWSAPAWMKTNGAINGRGELRGEPLGPYYHTWANYFVKFLNEYKNREIEFWGITVQNEPTDGTYNNFSFNCMAMNETQQRTFIADVLGPRLNESGYGPDRLKIMISDDQRPYSMKWANAIFGDTNKESAARYVAGLAFHWYLNAWTAPDILEDVHRKYPEFFLLSSEACAGASPFEPRKVSLGDWGRAESYAYDIIEDMTHHTAAWIDWNMALDTRGGPNWVQNFVDSPIIVNSTANEYYKQPMYYALAHFTRFLPPDSCRLLTTQSSDALQIVAFETTQNSTVVIVMNRYESTISFRVNDHRFGSFSDEIGGHSIRTYVWFD